MNSNDTNKDDGINCGNNNAKSSNKDSSNSEYKQRDSCEEKNNVNKHATTDPILVNEQPISPHQHRSFGIMDFVDGTFSIFSKENNKDSVICIAFSTKNPMNFFIARASSVASFLYKIKNLDDSHSFDITAGIGPFTESPSAFIIKLEEDIKERCNRSNNEHNFGAAVKLSHVLAVVMQHQRNNLRMFYSPIAVLESELTFDVVGNLNADVLLNNDKINWKSAMTTIGQRTTQEEYGMSSHSGETTKEAMCDSSVKSQMPYNGQQTSGDENPYLTPPPVSSPPKPPPSTSYPQQKTNHDTPKNEHADIPKHHNTQTSKTRTINVLESESDDSSSYRDLDKHLADIDMTRYQIVDNNIKYLSHPCSLSHTPNNRKKKSIGIVNPYLTPTQNRLQPRRTPSTTYPPTNVAKHRALPMNPSTNEKSGNSFQPNCVSAPNDGLLHGLTLASVKNLVLGCLRTVRMANFTTKCRLCGSMIKEFEDFIEEYAIMNKDGRVLTTRWDHVYGNCSTPKREISTSELNTPVNRRSVTDISSSEWIESASDIPSHHKSAPMQFNGENSIPHLQRSVYSEPQNMPSTIILPNINIRGTSTFSLQPRKSENKTELNVNESPTSNHSDITPATFTHNTESQKIDGTDLQKNQESEQIDHQHARKLINTNNTCNNQFMDGDLKAITAVNQSNCLKGVQPIEAPMIDSITNESQLSKKLVLTSVVKEALRAVSGVAYASPDDHLRAGVNYIASAGITDATFISLATEQLQQHLSGDSNVLGTRYEEADQLKQFDMEQHLREDQFHPGIYTDVLKKPTESNSKTIPKQHCKTNDRFTDNISIPDSVSIGQDICFKSKEGLFNFDSDEYHTLGDEIIDTDDEDEQVEKKTVELLQFMNERAKCGVNYSPEYIVKSKMRESPQKIKQRVTKAMRTALGMKENIVIRKHERRNKTNLIQMKGDSDNDSSTCNTHESKLKKNNTAPTPQFEKHLYDERKNNEYQLDGFLQQTDSEDSRESRGCDVDSDGIDESNILVNKTNKLRDRKLLSHKYINISRHNFLDASPDESSSSGFEDNESHDENTFGGSSTSSDYNIKKRTNKDSNTKMTNEDSDKDYELEDEDDDSTYSDDQSRDESYNGDNTGTEGKIGRQTTLEYSWEFATRRDA